MEAQAIQPQATTLEGLEITKTLHNEQQLILSPKACKFLHELHVRFNPTRKSLLGQRHDRQKRIDQGELPTFLPQTKEIRESDWTVAPVPDEIKDRRVEITGPVERKMIINALNSGACVFMADFEDSNTPTWTNIINGQINLQDAINGTITYTNPGNGKEYKLNKETAVLFVRPRGWHLDEKHLLINGEPMSGSLVDFGLYMYHNARTLIDKGSAPYFYLPKLESHFEARLWNDVFNFTQDYLSIPRGTIKATVLIETILASFELHEILYELKDHSAGLNCGRWDYIFSYIKKFRNHPGFVLPDRSAVTMQVPFMKAYSLAVIKTCHQRGAHAMGGMSAQIPIKNDDHANMTALEKVTQDKVNEARNGHDGTWVAHPGLVALAVKTFNALMPTANQIHIKRHDVKVTASELLAVPQGDITMEGFRTNINVGILYIESWLQGNGAAALYHLMEDAATAEISRTQLWQWIKNKSVLKSGETANKDLYERIKTEEIEKIKTYVGEDYYANGKFDQAIQLFDELVLTPDFIEFLTLPAYNLID